MQTLGGTPEVVKPGSSYEKLGVPVREPHPSGESTSGRRYLACACQHVRLVAQAGLREGLGLKNRVVTRIAHERDSSWLLHPAPAGDCTTSGIRATADTGEHERTMKEVSDALFRASSLAHVDPAWIDSQVTGLLQAMFGGEWTCRPPAVSLDGYVVSQVAVDGLAQDQIAVAVSPASCQELKEMLSAPDVSAEDLVCEVANVVAGHVKTALADGMSTGIPVLGAVPTQSGTGYRMGFCCGNAVVEVVSHG